MMAVNHSLMRDRPTHKEADGRSQQTNIPATAVVITNRFFVCGPAPVHCKQTQCVTGQ